jgi:hypothetical protein
MKGKGKEGGRKETIQDVLRIQVCKVMLRISLCVRHVPYTT